MLCSFCEGTENLPLPHTMIVRGTVPLPQSIAVTGEPDNCPTCGNDMWQPCPDCIGLGRKLKVAGHCGRCGCSMPYWEACASCAGEGKVYNMRHACASSGIRPAVERAKGRLAHLNNQPTRPVRRPGGML